MALAHGRLAIGMVTTDCADPPGHRVLGGGAGHRGLATTASS